MRTIVTFENVDEDLLELQRIALSKSIDWEEIYPDENNNLIIGLCCMLDKWANERYQDNQKDVFVSALAFQQWVRENKCPDIVTVAGILFTMDGYDVDGREITYGNIKHQKSMRITTLARYKLKHFADAIVEIYDMNSYRNDMHYEE